MTTEERNNRLRLGLLATIDGKEYGCSGTRPDKLRPSPWTLSHLNGDRVMGVSFESTWLHLDTPNPSKVLAFHTVLRKNRVWLWTVALTGDILTAETAWREPSDIDHVSPCEVRFSDGRKIEAVDSFKIRYFDGFEFQTGENPCIQMRELKPSEYMDNPRLLDAFELLPQLLGDDRQPSAQIRAGHTAQHPEDMLTIREAADYVGVNERTIRAWLNKQNGDKGPMLPGVSRVGERSIRIPRGSLEPWRK